MRYTYIMGYTSDSQPMGRYIILGHQTGSYFKSLTRKYYLYKNKNNTYLYEL